CAQVAHRKPLFW
nr:immunoglobulin heavy chain junction region [Macaca mulatta]